MSRQYGTDATKCKLMLTMEIAGFMLRISSSNRWMIPIDDFENYESVVPLQPSLRSLYVVGKRVVAMFASLHEATNDDSSLCIVAQFLSSLIWSLKYTTVM